MVPFATSVAITHGVEIRYRLLFPHLPTPLMYTPSHLLVCWATTSVRHPHHSHALCLPHICMIWKCGLNLASKGWHLLSGERPVWFWPPPSQHVVSYTYFTKLLSVKMLSSLLALPDYSPSLHYSPVKWTFFFFVSQLRISSGSDSKLSMSPFQVVHSKLCSYWIYSDSAQNVPGVWAQSQLLWVELGLYLLGFSSDFARTLSSLLS